MSDLPNIIEFAASVLDIHLTPVQCVILKAHYGIPLDTETLFEICTPQLATGQFIVNTWTEAKYLEYLYYEGRSNIREVDHERRELVLASGRRSGKGMLGCIIAAYEAYKLAWKGDPQAYYGLPPSTVLQILLVGTDKDQAGLILHEVNGFLRSTPLNDHRANNTQTYMRFQTRKDIDTYGSWVDDLTAKASIKVTATSSNHQGLRGAGNICVILDELAHYKEAENVYHAIMPSIMLFSKKAEDKRTPVGSCEGRLVSLSTPNGKRGMFHKLFMAGFNEKRSDNMLCLQIPTWEANPSIPMEFYTEMYERQPKYFGVEYGAHFVDLCCPQCGCELA